MIYIPIPSIVAAFIDRDDISIPTTNLDGGTQITDLLGILFGIFAAIAVLIIAISALKIVLSRGNSQEVVKARDSIIYASLGLVISLSAFAIVTFVLGQV